MGWGKRNRLSRLQSGSGYYFLFALDHSLTGGVISGLESIEKWIRFAESNQYISGVVLNSGELLQLPFSMKKGLILQMMGLPATQNQNFNKVVIGDIHDATRFCADAISLQICFESKDMSSAVERIAFLISNAHVLNYPVILMVNDAPKQMQPSLDVADKIKICTQLGADIIKISLQESILNQSLMKKLENTLPYGSPTVLAGGNKLDLKEFKKILISSARIGFKGVCIGRQVFQSENPDQIVEIIDNVFSSPI